ncbi:Caulimovirus viroplasmin-domain-containing protein [Biscogniauxia sp. FL1348]|nr:Caulimovirus viroplasmin-domain-containing protein [Biscogniauxia sp. FL1348]
MAKYRGPKFYAVRVGRKTGVFNTWEECQEQTSGFSGAKFKSFLSRDEALAWINEGQPTGHPPPITEVHDVHAHSREMCAPSDDDSEDSNDDSIDTEASLHSTPRGAQQHNQKPSQPGLLGHATLGNLADRESSSNEPSRPMTFSQIIKQQQQQQQSQQSQRTERERSNSSSSSNAIKREEPSSIPPPSAPPPASQSYFEQFPGFVPDASARFDDEFRRLASSQGLVAGTREFRRERTQALKSELVFHYSQPEPAPASPTPTSPPPTPTPTLFTPAQRLATYQSMCAAVGLEPQATISGCVRQLRGVLVNIVDFVDAKRRGDGGEVKVKVWDPRDFAAFSAYTLQDEHRFDKEEAKAHGGFLAKLLRRLDPRGGGGEGGGGGGVGVRRKQRQRNKKMKKKRGLGTDDGGEEEEKEEEEEGRPAKRVRARSL